MKGSITQRPQDEGKDIYRIQVSLGKDPVSGKYLRHIETWHGNITSARKRQRDLLSQVDRGDFIKPGKVTVAAYLDQWLRDYCRANLAPTTAQTYTFFVHKHIAPVIGNLTLSQLTPSALQHLYADKKNKGLGNRSVKYIHQTLHRALKSAVKQGLISRNPADSVDVPKAKSREMVTMTESEVHIALEYARGTPYFALLYVLVLCGLRRSEALALKWDSVDLALAQLSVTLTVHQLHDRQVIIRSPKTEKGRRLVSLSPSTVAVLREHRLEQEALRQKLELPAITGDDWVFGTYGKDGLLHPILPDTVSQAWRHLAKRLGLKARLHDLRHTCASLLLKGNVHPAVVAQWLGHSSVQITLDTYSHLLPGLQQQAADRLDEMLIPK